MLSDSWERNLRISKLILALFYLLAEKSQYRWRNCQLIGKKKLLGTNLKEMQVEHDHLAKLYREYTSALMLTVIHSRFMQKTDDELLFEILVRVEQVGSFCPEKLMCKKNNRLFAEVYRRFEARDKIVEQCVQFAKKFELIGAPVKR